MAALSNQSIDRLHAEMMAAWSSTHTSTPITKTQLRALLVFVDARLEAAEASIVSGLPNGEGKTWLTAHPTIRRRIIEETERRRRLDL